jgi:hypothetical protein
MKNMLSAISLVLLISTSIIATPKVVAAGHGQSLCEYVAADDKKRLRSYLKSNRLKIRKVFKGVLCNGKNLLLFAADQKSIKTGAMIISKLPKKIVTQNLDSLQSGPQELLDAATKRTGG